MNSSSSPYHTSWKQSWRHDSGTLVANARSNVSLWLITLLHMYPLPKNGDTVAVTREAVKRHPKVPCLRKRDANRWLFPRAVTPVLLHWIFWKSTDKVGHPFLVFLWYFTWFKIIGTSAIRLWHGVGQECGYLDGTKKREGVPDDSVHKIFLSLLSTSIGRTGLVTFLSYSPLEPPALDWTLLLHLAFYPIVMDFWFYLYHRSMHEVPALWRYHRTHHLTKHPNTLLTLFADVEQELFDIVAVPFLAYMTMHQLGPLRMPFYHWWICSMYQAVIEVGGHSGLRVYVGTFAAGFGLLEPLSVDLIIEDHDLHHRKGYRRSGNYGKQTLLWDRLFGTVIEREECVAKQIDFDDCIRLPW